MNDNDKLIIERACERLCIDFAWSVDHRHYDHFVDLFDTEGVFERPGLVCSGHAEIRRFLDARPQRVTRHLCSNVRIEVLGDDKATGSCQALMVQSVDEPDPKSPPRATQPLVVEWLDDYVRTPRGWKFRHRRTTVILQP